MDFNVIKYINWNNIYEKFYTRRIEFFGKFFGKCIGVLCICQNIGLMVRLICISLCIVTNENQLKFKLLVFRILLREQGSCLTNLFYFNISVVLIFDWAKLRFDWGLSHFVQMFNFHISSIITLFEIDW